MNPPNLNSFFEERIRQLQSEKSNASKHVKTLSFLRLIVFISYAIILVYLSNLREFNASLALTFVFILVFGAIVKAHVKANFKLNQLFFLIQINEEEIKRQQGELHDLPNGLEYFDPIHPYAPDLDIFGYNSLFQLIVRSRLDGTKQILSNWMLKGASKEEVSQRQTAVNELKGQIDWRQEMTALGMINPKKNQTTFGFDNLSVWLKDHLHAVDKPIWAILEIVMPLTSLILIFGFWLGGWPYQFLFIPILINLFVLKFIFEPLMKMTKEFDGIIHQLDGYGRIILQIEKSDFKSTLMIKCKNNLKEQGLTASKAIKALSGVFYFLQNRVNLIYLPLNMLFLLDLIIFRRTLSWKKRYQEKLKTWLDAVHQIDALNDLSAYAFANPGFVQPTVEETPHHISAKEMSHPLIKSHQRIANDMTMLDKGQLALITGSNMSGKSTFLRTLGLNIVLAQMGAVIAAKSFRWSITQLFTSMRTQDNLEENVSSFYAELKRIKLLLDSLDEENPMFYMLDEILKGTNSEDRHKGAISLIDQLTHENCMGLISTHDIQLADLSKKNPHIINYSFNSTIEGDEINFDYKLTDGACKSFNASKLMEKMGIIKKLD